MSGVVDVGPVVVTFVVIFVYVVIIRSAIYRFPFLGTFSVCRTQATDPTAGTLTISRFPVSCLLLVEIV